MLILIDKFINSLIASLTSLGEVTTLAFQSFIFIFKKPFSVKNLTAQIVNIGFDSIPVALLTALTVGMVFALQLGFTLESKLQGSAQFLGGVLGLSFVKELGPALTSLIVTGRVGSSIAAELGTMKVTEQIDALITLSTNPVQYLTVPRLIASILMFPALAMIADIVGLAGGMIIAITKFDSNVNTYLSQIIMYVDISDIVGGLIKSAFFGGIMAIISCYQGFRTFGGAEGVGKSTTRAVVYSSLAILISDYFLNSILILLEF